MGKLKISQYTLNDLMKEKHNLIHRKGVLM